MEGYRGMNYFVNLSHRILFNCIFYATPPARRFPLMSTPWGWKISFAL
jgi:hypothetical protein